MSRFFLSIKAFSVLVAATAALLLAAGCGSSGSSQGGNGTGEITVQTGSLSKADFIKQAGAICQATAKQSQTGFLSYTQRNKVPPSGPGLAAKASDFVNSVLAPIYQEQIEKITSLGAPSGDEERVAGILNAMQQGLNEVKQHPLEFIRGSKFFNKTAKLAAAYGLPSCSTS